MGMAVRIFAATTRVLRRDPGVARRDPRVLGRDPRGLACAVVCCVFVAGCGGGAEQRAVTAPTASVPTRTAPSPTQTAPAPPAGARGDDAIRKRLHLPARVPLRASSTPAPAADLKVVRAWFGRLAAGDPEGAARLFATPARFQNVDAIIRVRDYADAIAVTATLPCGAALRKTTGANGYVVYDAVLTERPGGSCGTGAGGRVRGAIRVEHGRITEWYRLPDTDPGHAAQAPEATGPVV